MGSYTLFSANIRLVNPPLEMAHVLEWLVDRSNNGCYNADLPDHDFFGTVEWRLVGCLGGVARLVEGVDRLTVLLSILGELRNYDDEIIQFLRWIAPYVSHRGDDGFIGYYQSDYDGTPHLIYVDSLGNIFRTREYAFSYDDFKRSGKFDLIYEKIIE